MLKIILFTMITVILLILFIGYLCYRIVFYVPRKKERLNSEPILPRGKIYEPYHDLMRHWILEARSLNSKDYTIVSFDGLKLHAKYFEFAKNAPLEIMFHGYRGSAETDLSGGIQRCFALGRSVLLVDQRTSCGSEGHVISFGINEHRDCLAWVDFAVKEFGPDVKIILTGISMGAATVLMAAGRPLPSNVAGVLADCGYSSAKEIIKKCAKDMHLPPNFIYPFVKLGARIYGHFDLEAYSPLEAVKTCKLPVLFIHGENDDFVPCEMSYRVYEACKSPKMIHTVKNAGHGLAYLMDNDGYFSAVTKFFTENGVPTALLEKPF